MGCAAISPRAVSTGKFSPRAVCTVYLLYSLLLFTLFNVLSVVCIYLSCRCMQRRVVWVWTMGCASICVEPIVVSSALALCLTVVVCFTLFIAVVAAV